MKRITEKSKEIQQKIISHRRYFHRHAESGFEIPKTEGYILKELRALGYKAVKCGKSGIIADIGRGETNTCVLLRADCDALDIEEKTGLDFACKSKRMHACGHDMHAAMLLGAAEIIKDYDIKGKIRLMFQPAEEILAGAKDMIDDGVLDGITQAVMIHVITATDTETATVIIPDSKNCAPSADFFRISITGKSCHGAMAEQGINAVSAVCTAVPMLEKLCSQKLPAFSGAALSIGRINGGKQANVLAQQVEIEGTFRTYDEKHREILRKQIKQIIKGTDVCYGTDSKVYYTATCPSLKNSDSAIKRAKNVLEECEIKIIDNIGGGSSGSEDFAYITEKVPSVMLILCAGDKKDGYVYPQHNEKTDFDEKALCTGAAIYAAYGLIENI